MHILITIFPRAEHRDPCPRFADHRLPALPLVQPLPPPPPPFRLTQAACRNLINLPVASRLAPCRHSEILYPSHPLKSEPTVERTAPSPLRPLALAIRARLPCSVALLFPSRSPFLYSLMDTRLVPCYRSGTFAALLVTAGSAETPGNG